MSKNTLIALALAVGVLFGVVGYGIFQGSTKEKFLSPVGFFDSKFTASNLGTQSVAEGKGEIKEVSFAKITTDQVSNTPKEGLNLSQGIAAPKVIFPQIKDYIPAVVSIDCYDGKGGVDRSGSGSVSFQDGEYHIYTTAHVARSSDGFFHGCWVYFPTERGAFYKSAYYAGKAYLFDDKIALVNGSLRGSVTYNTGGIDYAVLVLTEPGKDETGQLFTWPLKKDDLPDIAQITQKTCGIGESEKDISIGDKLYILGYPGIGGQTLTATEGIVSGFEDDYVKTSAKLEHGTSGGLAVLADTGCLVGVPSLVRTGSVESLGTIIPFSFLNTFLSAVENPSLLYADYNQAISQLSLDPDERPPFWPVFSDWKMLPPDDEYVSLLTVPLFSISGGDKNLLPTEVQIARTGREDIFFTVGDINPLTPEEYKPSYYAQEFLNYHDFAMQIKGYYVGYDYNYATFERLGYRGVQYKNANFYPSVLPLKDENSGAYYKKYVLFQNETFKVATIVVFPVLDKSGGAITREVYLYAESGFLPIDSVFGNFKTQARRPENTFVTSSYYAPWDLFKNLLGSFKVY